MFICELQISCVCVCAFEKQTVKKKKISKKENCLKSINHVQWYLVV